MCDLMEIKMAMSLELQSGMLRCERGVVRVWIGCKKRQERWKDCS